MTWYFILVSVEHLSRCVCFEQHFNLVNCLISCHNYMFFWLGRLTTKDGSKWSLGGPGGDKASSNHGGRMIRGELLLGFQSNHLTLPNAHLHRFVGLIERRLFFAVSLKRWISVGFSEIIQ